MPKFFKNQEIKKKSTSQVLEELELGKNIVFDLSTHKYSSLGATIQRKQIDTGKKFTQQKVENTLVVRRIA